MVSPQVQETWSSSCLSGPNLGVPDRSTVVGSFFSAREARSTSLSFYPHRSGRRTGSLTASVTSSLTTWRAACPLSLPGVSFVSGNQWRGNPELALRCAQVRRTWALLLSAYGNWGNCLWAHHLLQKPRERGFLQVQIS